MSAQIKQLEAKKKLTDDQRAALSACVDDVLKNGRPTWTFDPLVHHIGKCVGTILAVLGHFCAKSELRRIIPFQVELDFSIFSWENP